MRRKGILVSKSEDRLAGALAKKRVPFHRQVKIGIYRVDFLVPDKIVVDVFGPHHDGLRQTGWDESRRMYLERKGYRMYIFSASEAYNNPSECADVIAREYRKLQEEKCANP
jgi:very-short-patch-repair endonuclease